MKEKESNADFMSTDIDIYNTADEDDFGNYQTLQKNPYLFFQICTYFNDDVPVDDWIKRGQILLDFALRVLAASFNPVRSLKFKKSKLVSKGGSRSVGGIMIDELHCSTPKVSLLCLPVEVHYIGAIFVASRLSRSNLGMTLLSALAEVACLQMPLNSAEMLPCSSETWTVVCISMADANWITNWMFSVSSCQASGGALCKFSLNSKEGGSVHCYCRFMGMLVHDLKPEPLHAIEARVMRRDCKLVVADRKCEEPKICGSKTVESCNPLLAKMMWLVVRINICGLSRAIGIGKQWHLGHEMHHGMLLVKPHFCANEVAKLLLFCHELQHCNLHFFVFVCWSSRGAEDCCARVNIGYCVEVKMTPFTVNGFTTGTSFRCGCESNKDHFSAECDGSNKYTMFCMFSGCCYNPCSSAWII
eukprot:Gb_07533 [translate_table: standard]